MKDRIAVIGLSILLPGAADDPGEFANLLQRGADLVGPVPSKRKADSRLDPQVPLRPMACVDGVDLFDAKFFRISRREAEHMDPQHRWALQLACAAIENAGYNHRALRGSNACVITAAAWNNYYKLFRTPDPTAVLGNLSAALPARIAYYLDLRGPALAIDTACSSALVAVHEACSKLCNRTVDWAIVGAIRLHAVLEPEQGGAAAVEILSPRGRSRAFDANADGIGIGEGGGFLFLKRLSEAVAEHDHIHAVICGTAVNQDGGRSNGLAAPSPAAQSEVIQRAWREAGFDATSVGYVGAPGAPALAPSD
jgi:acyl transferase domain-containing protein